MSNDIKVDEATAKLNAEIEEKRRQLMEKAAIQQEIVTQGIAALSDDRQKAIYECCLQLRDMIPKYGPDIRYALALTSAEIASGTVQIVPAEEQSPIYLPGGGKTILQ